MLIHIRIWHSKLPIWNLSTLNDPNDCNSNVSFCTNLSCFNLSISSLSSSLPFIPCSCSHTFIQQVILPLTFSDITVNNALIMYTFFHAFYCMHLSPLMVLKKHYILVTWYFLCSFNSFQNLSFTPTYKWCKGPLMHLCVNIHVTCHCKFTSYLVS